MIDWSKLEDALYDWVSTTTGLTEPGQVLFAYPNVGRPSTPFVLINIQEVQALGIDDVVYTDSGLDLVQCLVGQRLITVDIQAFYVLDKANSRLDLARDAMSKLRCSWELASTTAKLEAGCLGQVSDSGLRDLSALDNGKFESRWAITFEFSAISMFEDTENVVSTIEEVKDLCPNP